MIPARQAHPSTISASMARRRSLTRSRALLPAFTAPEISSRASHRRPAQGHQGSQALRQDRHAPAIARRGGAGTAQARADKDGTARARPSHRIAGRIRRSPRSEAARIEGREVRQTIARTSKTFAAPHPAPAVAPAGGGKIRSLMSRRGDGFAARPRCRDSISASRLYHAFIPLR
jgi:hypothetical protein